MMNDFIHTKNFKVLVIVLAFLVVISLVSLSDNSIVSSAVNTVTKGLFQVTAAATASADTASTEDLKQENEKLKKENAELRQQLVDYYDTKDENKKLWKYYDIKKNNSSYSILPATVIKRDTNDDFYSFTLDIGSSSGVSTNDAVITDNGLVGWVSSVSATTCRVKTILSPDTKAGAVDKRTNDSAIVNGSTQLCDENLTCLTKIAENNKIKKGDVIVTSGTGGVYPKDLIIGKVKEVKFDKYDTSVYAVIEPYENFKTFSSAAVITDFDGKGKITK